MLSLTETANLSVLYAQSHRHYHNIVHIQNCLSELEAYKKSELKLEHTPAELDCIEKAIWYHDAIYNPYSSENEYNSAQLFLAEHGRTKETSWVAKTINTTAEHTRTLVGLLAVAQQQESTPWARIAAVVMDIDLASLGAPWDEFSENTRLIRKEYHRTSDSQFIAGRIAFMQTMLQRFKATGVLYYTPHFKERYEGQAIKNMENAIKRNETRPHFGYLPRTFP